ncbi:MAG TPA: patatin-like phospholipase family protein [Syntrophales bacterium]|nr:patatin-like phospholipase family protein [Syntrophales bacterium]HRT26916.1 patatin-like phospholipase family protein [Syntrophales bacterium]
MRLLRAIVVISVAALSIISCVAREIPPPPKPTRVALVLGAGASRGFAHIGVLKVLESNRIPVHMIVGTSAGSFVGCVYAFGYSAYQLQRMAIGLDKSDIVDLAIPDNGFIKGEKLENYVNQLVSNTPLERLRIPFYAVATDIRRGEEVVFGMGNTGTAVRASCSIPGVFRPVSISGATYVDGGVVSPIAVEAARKYGADVVIAVDISAGIGNSVPQTTIETILQSIDIMHSKISSAQLLKADVVITPRVDHIGSADFSKRHEAILEGERAANEALPRIQSILNTFRSQGRL